MGRGKIERETKREKKRFSLGRKARKRYSRRREQSVAAFKKIAKEKRVKCCFLREDSQEDLCGK